MFHMAFDFPYGYFWGVAFLGQNSSMPFDAMQTVVTQYPPGAQDAMLIGSHDVGRAWSNAQELAWRMQRAFEISMFSKATPFVYYGDELALHDGTTFVVDSRDSRAHADAVDRGAGSRIHHVRDAVDSIRRRRGTDQRRDGRR